MRKFIHHTITDPFLRERTCDCTGYEDFNELVYATSYKKDGLRYCKPAYHSVCGKWLSNYVRVCSGCKKEYARCAPNPYLPYGYNYCWSCDQEFIPVGVDPEKNINWIHPDPSTIPYDTTKSFDELMAEALSDFD